MELFCSADPPELAKNAGRKLSPGFAGFVEVSSALNDAFSDYANASAMQADDSPAGERRRWCTALARGSNDLGMALGYAELSGELHAAAFSAMDSLEKGWPRYPEDQEAVEYLRRLLMVAVPDKFAASGGLGSEPDLKACWMALLGRLGPALAAVAAVAGSSARAWSSAIARGGSNRDQARRHLIKMLVDIFTQLFGQPPEAAPGSGGFRWFSATIEMAGNRAAVQRDGMVLDRTDENQVLAAALEAIQALASHIVAPSYQLQSRGTGKLDHWLREAINAGNAHRARAAAPSPAAPLRSTRGSKPKKRV
ncbi:hypothetical protein [Lichenicoccus roseus]|uniref:Uncharacterized protein n=1 Tax=Lichenicoccus roseus TaxID=2683649 RepID=A0A5R9J307_9PROT|nr:hypothetical protein [Lichenicoccus roseus]TLU71223.1 hypothetical protein FE263_17080 [Lichenicoccus roseus]